MGLIDYIIYLLLLVWFYVLCNNYLVPNIIGWFGEYWVKQLLEKLPKNRYIVLNDVLLKFGGATYQIDHIVISKYGIFVIETKQYNGYITGSKYDKKWIRHFKNKKMYYTNPIRQNYGHVKAIESLLNFDDDKVFNVVCIPSKNVKLKIIDDGELVRYDGLLYKIKSYNYIVINNIDEVVKTIKENSINSRKMRKQHIRNIKKNIKKKEKNICPKCGGQLIERNGPYGTFLGCSNYPKCKFTKNNK